MINLNKVAGVDAAKQKEKDTKPRSINELDNKAFMKLFLEQLKNQDPTAPMETDKIITQTAQLTQVEMQEENKKTMKEVSEAMKSTRNTNTELIAFQKAMKESLESLNKNLQSQIASNEAMAQTASLNAIGLIGKIAQTNVTGVNVGTNTNDIKLDIYFDAPIDVSKGTPQVEILDAKGGLVSTIPIKNSTAKAGYHSFTWNLADKNGERVGNGSYQVRARYNMNKDGHYAIAGLGRGEIQGVLFDKGVALLRLGEMVLPLRDAVAFYDKGAKLPPLNMRPLSAPAPQSASKENRFNENGQNGQNGLKENAQNGFNKKAKGPAPKKPDAIKDLNPQTLAQRLASQRGEAPKEGQIQSKLAKNNEERLGSKEPIPSGPINENLGAKAKIADMSDAARESFLNKFNHPSNPAPVQRIAKASTPEELARISNAANKKRLNESGLGASHITPSTNINSKALGNKGAPKSAPMGDIGSDPMAKVLQNMQKLGNYKQSVKPSAPTSTMIPASQPNIALN